MPRPKKEGAGEPKKRSRNGCWPCKNRKIKCGEERPHCLNCEKQGETCDYSIRLNWEGRTKRKEGHENQHSNNTFSPPLKSEVSGNSNQSDATVQGSSSNPPSGFAVGQFSSFNPATLFQAQPTHRDHISTAQLSRIRDQGPGPYPSPADSALESPPPNSVGLRFSGQQPPVQHGFSNPEMPPPYPASPYTFTNSQTPQSSLRNAFAEHRAKRIRLSPSADRVDNFQKAHGVQLGDYVATNNALNVPPLMSTPAVRNRSSSPFNNMRVPPTPAASIGSEDNQHSLPAPSPQSIAQESPDFRRLSVKSLLSDDSPAESTSGSESVFPGKLNISSSNSAQKTSYGIDRGFPDQDLPRNQDATALNGITPTLETASLDHAEYESSNDLFSGFGFGVNASDGFQEGAGYYAKPVTVSISRSLEPLPAMLKDNPMNLLYFHHFLNHTARILVPHDCSGNPFKSILPQMAVQDTNLLNLLLTYSASHRSRVLNHAEPASRIAFWMSNVFPSLRRALDDPSRQISDSNLATAIMLASLQILNPNTFGKAVSWQQHLHVARQMILARGGPKSVRRQDMVPYFLTRWFAYLDVLGSLSGGNNDQPLFSGNYWTSDCSGEEQDYQIDCLLGFTSRCVSILARIAELARTCDRERIDPAGNVNQVWQPSWETVQEAAKLKNDLVEARQHRYQGCPHRRTSTQIEESSYAVELVTTNEAFHHAGFIHVNRRILGKPSTDPEVQFAVREIVSALYKVRKGGTAEGCLLFPMFTAGCEAQDDIQRMKIMERLQRMEGLGMSQVKKARALMEKVWETGRPWETLVTGDFFLG